MRMKKILFTAATASIVLFACKSGDDKSAKLEKLKKSMAEMQVEVDSLQAQIARTDTTKRIEKIQNVAVATVAPVTFTSYIEVQGKVDADENVTISPEIGGVVTKINVKAGDEVSKGQVLAELDAKVIQQSIAELQTGLELSTTLYNRQKSLWDQKIGTEVQFLSAKNQKEGLEKKMATLQQQVELARIKSPINGTVDENFLKLGQAAAPGFPAMRVVNFANLKVKAEVPENYASKVKKGNPAIILFPDINDSVLAPVSFSAKVINAVNRSFTVEVALDNTKDFHPNMIAILRIIDYTNKAAIAVQQGTIQHAEDGDFVFTDNHGRAKRTKVIVGHQYNGKAEITSGLKEGDKVIVAGYQDLNENEAIKY